MLRSILVGLDGSAYSISAMELAIRWAKRTDAILAGLGIIDEPTIFQPEPVPIGAHVYKQQSNEHRLAEARLKVEQFLETFALRCAEAKVSCKVLEDVGLPHEQIILESQRYDLIVLGQQSYFQFETQEGPGKTLHKVLKHSPRPVVTVPQVLGVGRAIVIAYDGSRQAARALQTFEALRPYHSHEVHIVSVNASHLEAAHQADRALEFLRSHEMPAHPHVLATSAPVAEVILDQANKLDAGLLVLGAYGHSALREFFFGSVSKTLLRESPVPLFLDH